MKAYVDSSVVLRVALGAPEPLTEWGSIDQYVSSSLLLVECARTMERLRIVENASSDKLRQYRGAVAAIVAVTKLVAIEDSVLERAAAPFALALKSLDAIHLATAIVWRDKNRADLAFATHDDKLARAARAAGFEVLGA